MKKKKEKRVKKVFRIHLLQKEKQIFVSKKILPIEQVSYYVKQMIWVASNYKRYDIVIIITPESLAGYTVEQFKELWEGAPDNIKLKFKDS